MVLIYHFNSQRSSRCKLTFTSFKLIYISKSKLAPGTTILHLWIIWASLISGKQRGDLQFPWGASGKISWESIIGVEREKSNWKYFLFQLRTSWMAFYELNNLFYWRLVGLLMRTSKLLSIIAFFYSFNPPHPPFSPHFFTQLLIYFSLSSPTIFHTHLPTVVFSFINILYLLSLAHLYLTFSHWKHSWNQIRFIIHGRDELYVYDCAIWNSNPYSLFFHLILC